MYIYNMYNLIFIFIYCSGLKYYPQYTLVVWNTTPIYGSGLKYYPQYTVVVWNITHNIL